MDPFSGTGDVVRLTARIPSDVAAFLSALDRDDAESAVQLYAGDFFPDFAAPGGAAFEHWADTERARLRSMFVGAATRVVRDRLGKGRARDAIVTARRTLELAPRHQAAWRLLLESYVAADDIVGAAMELERLERWLAAEEMEPDPATTQIIKAVRTGKSSSTAGGAVVDPVSKGLQAELVAREFEFAELLAAFEQVKRGRPRHMHISAHAGFGKTRLLDGFAARLRSSRVRVVTVRATIAERSLQYAFAGHLVSALVQLRGASAVSPDAARTLVGLAPSSSNYLKADADRSIGEEALRRRSLAITELVSAISHESPLVLIVDDVHWIDAQSRTLLTAIATRSVEAPLMLVTAARTGDEFIESIPESIRLTLSALSLDDISALVTSIGRLPVEPWTDALLRGLQDTSAGSPLLVLESLQFLMEAGFLHCADQAWSSPEHTALISALDSGSAMQQRLAKLPRAAQDVLLQLSVAGAPVTDEVLTNLIWHEGREAMTLLETRGLVSRSVDCWRVSHDEIAALSIELASPQERMRANATMAEHLERICGEEVGLLIRAAWHRARAGDTESLDRTFIRAVRSARAIGQQSVVRDMAREILGPTASASDIDQLVRRVPWGSSRLFAGWAKVLAFGVVAVLTISLFMRRAATSTIEAAEPDAKVSLFLGDDEARTFADLPVFLGELGRGTPIDLVSVSAPIPLSVFESNMVFDQLPDGRFIGSTLGAKTPVEGTDLVEISPQGDVTPFLRLRHDQTGAVLSPDGRSIAFTSGEWSDEERTDIAIVDALTRQVRQVTKTRDWERSLRWSPDGSRIAFLRSHVDSANAEVCTIVVSNSHEQCYQFGDRFTPQSVLGWNGERGSLLVMARTEPWEQNVLIRLSLRDGEVAVADSEGTSYMADPLGKVAMCICRASGFDFDVVAAFDPWNAGQKRVVERDGRPLRRINEQYVNWRPTHHFLSSIAVQYPDTAFVGQTLSLRAEGRNEVGGTMQLPPLSWKSLDTGVARIDPSGLALARRPGTARIVVSGSGVRAETVSVSVTASKFARRLSIDWRRPLDSAWYVTGTPAPTADVHGGTRVLHINGDGYLMSGVISRLSVDPKTGVGARARVRIPVHIANWQQLAFVLSPVAEDAQLLAWGDDRIQGLEPPSWLSSESRTCSINAPLSEGGENLWKIGMFVAGVRVRWIEPSPRLVDGRWHVVTLQINVDGRCMLAIDNVPVAASRNFLQLDRPVRVKISGQSVGTDVEVAAVEMWSGVRDDIDWSPLLSNASAVGSSRRRQR
jgi:hypothetical protein